MSDKRWEHFRGNQGGAVLIVSLILLLVMTLLGVSAMQSTILEEKMAGNFRDRDLAFQAAEAALRHAENEILQFAVTDFATWPTSSPLSATNGLLGESYDDSGVDYTPASSIWTTPGSYRTYDHPDYPSEKDPRYIIKHVSTSGGNKRIFKITAYAQGKSQGTAVVLRSFYERTD